MAREILNLQPVAFLCLFKDYVYSLNGKDRSLLTKKYRCANAGWVNVVVALGYMLPELLVQAYDSCFACLFLDYSKLFGVQYLPPPESKNIGNSIPRSEKCEEYKRFFAAFKEKGYKAVPFEFKHCKKKHE